MLLLLLSDLVISLLIRSVSEAYHSVCQRSLQCNQSTFLKICVYFPSNARFWNRRQKLHVRDRGEGKEDATGNKVERY